MVSFLLGYLENSCFSLSSSNFDIYENLQRTKMQVEGSLFRWKRHGRDLIIELPILNSNTVGIYRIL